MLDRLAGSWALVGQMGGVGNNLVGREHFCFIKLYSFMFNFSSLINSLLNTKPLYKMKSPWPFYPPI